MMLETIPLLIGILISSRRSVNVPVFSNRTYSRIELSKLFYLIIDKNYIGTHRGYTNQYDNTIVSKQSLFYFREGRYSQPLEIIPQQRFQTAIANHILPYDDHVFVGLSCK